MMSKDEKRRMKKHFLGIAKKCEKQNYSIQAADIYRRYYPKKAKNLYLKVAKDCEKNKLYIGAAEAYGLAGKMKKSRQIWKTYAGELKKKDLPTIEKEILEKATPHDPKKEKINKEAWKILSLVKKLEREGKFSEAQKYFIRAAEFREKHGELRAAAYLYFDGCDAKNAESVWKKIIHE